MDRDHSVTIRALGVGSGCFMSFTSLIARLSAPSPKRHCDHSRCCRPEAFECSPRSPSLSALSHRKSVWKVYRILMSHFTKVLFVGTWLQSLSTLKIKYTLRCRYYKLLLLGAFRTAVYMAMASRLLASCRSNRTPGKGVRFYAVCEPAQVCLRVGLALQFSHMGPGLTTIEETWQIGCLKDG